jgi:hypothetical protein
MEHSFVNTGNQTTRHQSFTFRFTPAEWRHLLEDPDFLREPGNQYAPPRQLMGVKVEIVPDVRTPLRAEDLHSSC